MEKNYTMVRLIKRSDYISIRKKVDFRAQNIIKYKEGYFIMRKGSICQKKITILNIYAFNKKA